MLISSRKDRFWIFAGMQYYPTGGMQEFCGSTYDLDCAIAYCQGYFNRNSLAWVEIYDAQDDVIVCHAHDENDFVTTMKKKYFS